MLWWASCMPPGLRHLHAAAVSTCAAAWIACGLPRHSAHRACKCCGVVFGVIAAAAAAASTDGTAPPVVHAWQGPYASSPSVACTQLKNGSRPTCFIWVAGVCHTGCMLCCTPAALVALVRSCSAGRARGRRACAPSPRAVCIPWVSSSGCSWPGSRAGKHEHQQFQSPPEHITTAWQAGQALLWPFGRAGCAATGDQLPGHLGFAHAVRRQRSLGHVYPAALVISAHTHLLNFTPSLQHACGAAFTGPSCHSVGPACLRRPRCRRAAPGAVRWHRR